MNNYFKFSKRELCVLLMSQQRNIIDGFEIDFSDLDVDETTKLINSLEKKGYIRSEQDGGKTIFPQLDAWMYVVTHPFGFSKCYNDAGELLVFYYLDSNIVSIHVCEEQCELIWLPSITLAMGQTAEIIKKEKCNNWYFSAQIIGTDYKQEYTPNENETEIEIIKKVFGLFVSVHGMSIEGRVKA